MKQISLYISSIRITLTSGSFRLTEVAVSQDSSHFDAPVEKLIRFFAKSAKQSYFNVCILFILLNDIYTCKQSQMKRSFNIINYESATGQNNISCSQHRIHENKPYHESFNNKNIYDSLLSRRNCQIREINESRQFKK